MAQCAFFGPLGLLIPSWLVGMPDYGRRVSSCTDDEATIVLFMDSRVLLKIAAATCVQQVSFDPSISIPSSFKSQSCFLQHDM
jgi:hypothetical protein